VEPLTSIPIDLDKPLPRVCFKCSVTSGITRRSEILAVTSNNARNMGMIGGAIGAGIASMLRKNNELVVPMLGVLAVGVALFTVYTTKTVRRVELAIPLCSPCDERWSKAKSAHPFFVAAFIGSALALLLGLVSESKGLMIAAGVLFFSVCVYAIVTKPVAAYVGAVPLDDSRIILTQVNERTVAMIRNGEVPKRKKKSKPSPVSEPLSEPDE
jgi:hypothetical protein